MDTRILKYVPKKKQQFVKDCWQDCDGYWIKLKSGYIFDSMRTTVVVQDKLSDLKYDISTIIEDV